MALLPRCSPAALTACSLPPLRQTGSLHAVGPYTLAEVKKHNNRDSAWIAVAGALRWVVCVGAAVLACCCWHLAALDLWPESGLLLCRQLLVAAARCWLTCLSARHMRQVHRIPGSSCEAHPSFFLPSSICPGCRKGLRRDRGTCGRLLVA